MIISNLNKKALICWRRHNRKLCKLNLRHTELRDIRAGEEVVEDYVNYVFGHTPWANYYMSTYYPERKALENTYIHRAPANKSI